MSLLEVELVPELLHISSCHNFPAKQITSYSFSFTGFGDSLSVDSSTIPCRVSHII